MGDGLKRANAAARASRAPLSAREVVFLRRLAEHDGICDRSQLPAASWEEDKARQRCRRLGLASYAGGYWRLSEAGRAEIQPAGR